MAYQNEAVRAIRALRLLRDACKEHRDRISGEEFHAILIRHLGSRSGHTTDWSWAIELMVLLLKAQLIQVFDGSDNRPLTADKFEVMYKELGLKRYFFDISPHYAELKRALGITSLSSLERSASPDSVNVSPVHGAPRTSMQNHVFVLMPFTAILRPVYDQCILPTANSLGLTVARADDLFSGRTVMQKVWGAIFGADLVIADCTGRNPNVFYELGMAHTIGKSTIIITQKIDDIPFDIRQFEYHLYENTLEGRVELARVLKTAIPHLIDSLMPKTD